MLYLGIAWEDLFEGDYIDFVQEDGKWVIKKSFLTDTHMPEGIVTKRCLKGGLVQFLAPVGIAWKQTSPAP